MIIEITLVTWKTAERFVGNLSAQILEFRRRFPTAYIEIQFSQSEQFYSALVIVRENSNG